MTRRLMVVLGTRPDAIKLAPVIAALRAKPQCFETIVCSTDQHREMLDQALTAFGVTPDIRLNVMRPDQTLPDLTVKLISELTATIADIKPDRLVLQGDTTTAFAAALSAYYERIPVAHVEAGLRSNNRYSPFPEEVNRRAISCIADLHFAPTRGAADALASEGAPSSSVYVTGNTVVDALQSFRRALETEKRRELVSPWILEFADDPSPIIFVSCHRRESFGADLSAICRAVARIAENHHDHRIVFPVHLNPNVRAQVAAALGNVANISLIDPVAYPEMLFLLSRAKLALSDSGGIQEEAPSFGVPLLVLRKNTERPEAVAAGLSFLVGSDEELIVGRAEELLKGAPAARCAVNPYGDGHAAERIAEILARTP
jgi:UDP-N-acetylglucosamine 2-epimerase (non-hydrolysing)